MKKKALGFLGQFKEFALKGNVIDLAVGIIIGGAFQAIVNSLVKDVITPLLGKIGGNFDFTNAFIILGKLPANADESKLSSISYVRGELGTAVFAYGSFITAIINFIIMALIIFFLVKAINKLKTISIRKQVEEETITTKDCPYCKTEIAIEATRCAHCTSHLVEAEQKN